MKLPGKRRTNLAGFVVCAGLMAYALYAQYQLFLEPCPLCVFQRMAVIGLGLFFLLAAIHNPGGWGSRVYALLIGIVAAAGVIIGRGVAFGLTRLMSALLYGVSAADPVTYTLAVALIALVCFIASYIPARRAAGVDPMEALRGE